MKFFKIPELYCAILLVASVILVVISQPKIENVQLFRGSTSRVVSLPLAESMGQGEIFHVEFDLKSMWDSYDLRIIPDDCAERVLVNDSVMDISSVQGRCDFGKGFLLQDSLIATYRNGSNTHFSFFIKNNGGNAGINASVIMKNPLSRMIEFSAIGFLALLCALIARRLRLGGSAILILFIGIALRAFIFAHLPYNSFSNDVDGHVAYVKYIIDNRSIPGVDDCWTCYHPPVYYVSAIPSYLAATVVGVSANSGLQMYSLLLSILTLFFGVFFFKNFLSGSVLKISIILWTFWPLMLLVAPRIGNDQMFYMFHLLCLWSGVNYLNKGNGKYLIVTVLSSALALWTKSTGAVSIGMTFLFAVCGYFRNARFLRPTKSEFLAWFLFLVVVLLVVFQKLMGGSDLVGNSSGLNSALKVGNEAFNYIYFDLESFVTHPFTNAWVDEMGRQYFWNYMFKTSLFGEFDISKLALLRNLAVFISVFFIGLLVCAIRGFWNKKLDTIHWLLIIQGAAFVAALMFLRIKHPYSCSNDFRYIAPAIVSVIPFMASGVVQKGASAKWKTLGVTCVLGFVLCSAILYILAV